MVLPPIETTPVVVLRFVSSTSDHFIDLVEQRLVRGGMRSLGRCSSYDDDDDEKDDLRKPLKIRRKMLLKLTSTQRVLEETAESIHLMKLTTNTSKSSSSIVKDSTTVGVMEYFTVQDRVRFCRQVPPVIKSIDTQLENIDEDDNIDQDGLFTSNDWIVLVSRILDDITVLDPTDNVTTSDSTTSELAQLLIDTYHADPNVHSYDETDMTTHLDKVTTASTTTESQRSNSSNSGQIREIGSIQKHGEQSACLRHVLETYHIVELVSYVHIPTIRYNILHRTIQPWYQLMPPIDDIFNYYGWEVAFYFAWMGFLTKWLLFPGILGLFFWLLRWYRNDTIEEDEYTPFYGLITFLWGILFTRFWQRHENRLAYQWGTYSLSPYEKQKYFAIRPDFRGYQRLSPISGLMETYYPPIYRRFKFVGSAIVTIAMLCVAFAVMIMSLNLQGYIHPQSNPKRWNDNSPHPFHVRSLAVLSEEGRLFDAKSAWRSLVPVVLHVICIFVLNKIYRIVAEALTSWENHETNINHRNSIVLKRFLFEAFDCYIALFYLAFYERDVDRLRLELMSVFQIDTLRRILLECIVPMIIQRILSKRMNKGNKSEKNLQNNNSYKKHDPIKFAISEDLELDEYDQFDDYMEIVIQLGYVTLFASAYPLASLISIIANWVEIRSDCFKLTHVCRRPISIRSSGLGMWRTLISAVIWTSAITNCLIAGFTSGQLTHYLPEFYIRDKDTGDYNIDEEDGWLVIFVIFGLERLLIIFGLLILAIVPATPEDVVDEIERRQYVRLQQRTISTSNISKKKDD
jgi:anoctamin-10